MQNMVKKTRAKLQSQIVNSGQDNSSTIEKIDLVNNLVNTYEYNKDKENYGLYDYYANKEEFEAKNGGDCEDFAFVKSHYIQQAGIEEENITFLYCALSMTKKHMVLIVKADDGERYVMEESGLIKYEDYTKEDGGMRPIQEFTVQEFLKEQEANRNGFLNNVQRFISSVPEEKRVKKTNKSNSIS